MSILLKSEWLCARKSVIDAPFHAPAWKEDSEEVSGGSEKENIMDRKHALVTGASHGIGRAIAVALARNGYDVAVNYCSSEAAALQTCDLIRQAGGRALPLKADVGSYDQLIRMFEEYDKIFGTLDFMMNNAGVSEFHPLLEVTEQQWDRVMRIDWKGVYFGTQQAALRMKDRGGCIMNMSSNHVDGCFPDASIYASAKAAVAKFTENAAMELAPYHIRVLALAPGYTKVWSDDNPINQAAARIPLKRFATPEEIAEIVVFLASGKCSYMTGNRITIDGGALLPVVPENAMEAGALLPLKVHESSR